MSNVPARMTAIVIRAPGGPEMLVPEERPVPQPGPAEVLVKVAAAGVNRPDVMQRMGQYPPPKGATDIPGLELAGEMVALVPEPQALPIPAGLSMTEAGAMPETFFTVYPNVFERGALKAGETLLVHGGSSGIGTVAIMLGKAFGARVFATAGSAEKCEACKRLGAEVAINYKSEDFVAVAKKATADKGVDVVLDMVGGDYIDRNYDVAAVEGRIIQIAFQASPKATVDFRRMLTKRLLHTGSGLRPRSVADKGKIAQALEAKVWPLIAAGKVKPVIDSTYPLARAAAAHERMESSQHIGKIVLTV
jgi:putative PIG3 family NAD(P)H quinone oxidoreductase